MYIVETNKYSHNLSTASRVVSSHYTLDEAKTAALVLWNGGTQRFVYVTYHRREVYNPSTGVGDAVK